MRVVSLVSSDSPQIEIKKIRTIKTREKDWSLPVRLQTGRWLSLAVSRWRQKFFRARTQYPAIHPSADFLPKDIIGDLPRRKISLNALSSESCSVLEVNVMLFYLPSYKEMSHSAGAQHKSKTSLWQDVGQFWLPCLTASRTEEWSDRDAGCWGWKILRRLRCDFFLSRWSWC